MSADVLKNSGDIDNYEAEFNDLRSQLYNMTQSEFNGALFGDWDKDDTTSAAASDGIFGRITTVPMSHSM